MTSIYVISAVLLVHARDRSRIFAHAGERVLVDTDCKMRKKKKTFQTVDNDRACFKWGVHPPLADTGIKPMRVWSQTRGVVCTPLPPETVVCRGGTRVRTRWCVPNVLFQTSPSLPPLPFLELALFGPLAIQGRKTKHSQRKQKTPSARTSPIE